MSPNQIEEKQSNKENQIQVYINHEEPCIPNENKLLITLEKNYLTKYTIIASIDGFPFTLHKKTYHISRTSGIKGAHYYARMGRVDKWTNISMDTYKAFDSHLDNLHRACNNMLEPEVALTYRLRSIQFLYRPEEVKTALRRLKEIYKDLKDLGLKLPNYSFLYVAVAELFSRFYLIKGKIGSSGEWSHKGLHKAHFLEPCERTGLMLRANGQWCLQVARVNAKARHGVAYTKLKAKAGMCFELMVQHFWRDIEEGGEFEFYVLEGYLLMLYTKLDCFSYRMCPVVPGETNSPWLLLPLNQQDQRIVKGITQFLKSKLGYLVEPYEDMIYILHCFELILDFKTNPSFTRDDLAPYLASRRQFEQTGCIRLVTSAERSDYYVYNNPSFNFLLQFSNIMTEPLTGLVYRTLVQTQVFRQNILDSEVSGDSDIM